MQARGDRKTKFGFKNNNDAEVPSKKIPQFLKK